MSRHVITQDVAHLVNEQQEALITIADSVQTANTQVQIGISEMNTAKELQAKSRKKMCAPPLPLPCSCTHRPPPPPRCCLACVLVICLAAIIIPIVLTQQAKQ